KGDFDGFQRSPADIASDADDVGVRAHNSHVTRPEIHANLAFFSDGRRKRCRTIAFGLRGKGQWQGEQKADGKSHLAFYYEEPILRVRPFPHPCRSYGHAATSRVRTGVGDTRLVAACLRPERILDTPSPLVGHRVNDVIDSNTDRKRRDFLR